MPALFNQIFILDSLPAKEAGAARRLFDDVSVQARTAAEAPAVVLHRAGSFGHFANVMEQCAQLAEREPYVPLVHLECHGSQDGLQFADGSQATWSEVKQTLTPLNVATRLNLIVVISACNGSTLAGTVEVSERARYGGSSGPIA